MAIENMTQVDALEVVVNVLTKNGDYSADTIATAVAIVEHMLDVKKNAIAKKSNTVSEAAENNQKVAKAIRTYIQENDGAATRVAIIDNVAGVHNQQKLTSIMKTAAKYYDTLGFKFDTIHAADTGKKMLVVIE